MPRVLIPLFALFIGLHAQAQTTRFDFETLSEIARERAVSAHAPSKSSLPAELAKLDYDQVRDIRFKPERSLWRDKNGAAPFEAQFFHLGLYQTEPVRIHEITPQGVATVAWTHEVFDYGKNRLNPAGWGDLGYAGFRIHYPLNNPSYKDELAVFLGASYFRALGSGQHYGLSARGLAIDTVGGSGEEFPRFTEFWLERPSAQASSVTVYALLESPRATGAYRFEIRPGADTVMTVRARLFARVGAKPIATLGIAPLTSMFLSGENQPRPGDFRPEVHDSDGLMVALQSQAGQPEEWLWRPLQHPKTPLVTSFSAERLRGFGLMQRDRVFASYEDTEARYERRPSVWVQPISDWGPGRVELVQLPSPDETHDNVVAYWVPAQALTSERPQDLHYALHWQGDVSQRPPSSWVVQSRRGFGYSRLSERERASQVQYVIDFTGPALAALPPGADMRGVVSSNAAGRVLESNVWRHPEDVPHGPVWRLVLRVQRLSSQPIELRAFLQHDNHAVSETWSQILLPE